MLLKNNEHRLVGRWPSRLEHADGRALDAERGVLLVPSSRRPDESAAIALPFIRVLAERDHGLPPLVVLFGGPGVGAIDAFHGYFFEHVERLAVCQVSFASFNIGTLQPWFAGSTAGEPIQASTA